MAVTENAPFKIPYLSLLWRLKWRLQTRGFRRNRATLVGAILGLLIFLPIAIGVAVGLTFVLWKLGAPWNGHILRGALLAIYLFWVVTPLFGFVLSDSYDITKLFFFPLSVRQIFVGAVFGSLLDFTTLITLPLLIAAIVGFAHSIGVTVLAVVAISLFLLHTLTLSQAAMLASAGILRSRRARDLAMVILPLFWITYYIGTQMLARRGADLAQVNWKAWINGPIWNALGYLPPGLAARSIALAQSGQWGIALPLLALLGVITVLTIYFAGWILQRVYAGERVGPRLSEKPAPRARQNHASASSRRPLENWTRRLPPAVAAIVEKEARYVARDPYFKVVLMNFLYMGVIGVFMFWRGGPLRNEFVLPYVVGGIASLPLLSEMQLCFNQFGTDSAAVAALLATPAPRRQMLIGKNLSFFLLLSVVNIVFLTLLCSISKSFALFLPILAWQEIALAVLLSVGNLMSIWFPVRVVLKGWRIQQQGASQGCAYGFLYLAVMAGTGVLLLPVLVAIGLPIFLNALRYLPVTILLAGLYAAGLYLLSLKLAAPLLLEREQHMLRRLTATENG